MEAGCLVSGERRSQYLQRARQALSSPAFMRYDSTLAGRFPITKRKIFTMVNQNYLLTQYKGGIGGKIGWTIKAMATYVGLARRHGVTLIVTVLHCTPLQEIYAAEKLLNWGFAMEGHVPHGSASLSGLAAGASTSHAGQVAIGAAIAAVLCAGLVGFILLRRRATTAKKSAT